VVSFSLFFDTGGDTSTMMRDTKAHACTQNDRDAVDDFVPRASIAAVLRFLTDEFFEIEHWLTLSRSKFQQLLVRPCDVFFFYLISPVCFVVAPSF